MPTTPDEGSPDEVRAEHLKKRRSESEVFMLQSDRDRLVRQSDQLDAEIRSLEKNLKDRELDLDSRKAQRKGIILKIQSVEAELLQLKRQSYKKH